MLEKTFGDSLFASLPNKDRSCPVYAFFANSIEGYSNAKFGKLEIAKNIFLVVQASLRNYFKDPCNPLLNLDNVFLISAKLHLYGLFFLYLAECSVLQLKETPETNLSSSTISYVKLAFSIFNLFSSFWSRIAGLDRYLLYCFRELF